MRTRRNDNLAETVTRKASRLRGVLSVALLSLLTLVAGCGEGAQSEPSMVAQPERDFFYERDFAENPALAAQAQQSVILDLEPASAGHAVVEDVTRYQLDEDTYTFCLEEDDADLQSLILENEAGASVVNLERSSGCVDATLPAGDYRMRIFHDGSTIAAGEAHHVAFVHIEKRSVPLLDGTGVPRSGFWALRPDPSLDPSGQRREGRVRALPPPQNLQDFFGLYTKLEPLIADFSSKQIDDTALFNFQGLGGEVFGPLPFVLSGRFPLNIASLARGTFANSVFADGNGSTASNAIGIAGLSILDGGNQRVQVQRNEAPPSFFTVGDDSLIRNLTGPASSFEVLFRFFPDGDPHGTEITLGEGEVALFQECNYQGRATVFVVDTPDFSALTSSVITLDKTTASVKVGPHTGVLLYSGGAFSGTSQLIARNTACLDTTPIGRNTTSIQVGSPRRLVLISKSCVNCDLSGIDLSGANLSGADLQGANLSAAILAGAKTDLSGALFNNASLKNADLSVARLYGANFTNANLEGANLRSAFLTNNLSAGIRNPANFTGAHLKDVNLSSAQLNGTIFDSASFYGSFDGQAPTFPCQTDTSKCPNATTGFTCGCASAVGATMVDTQFANAYLYGVDFSGPTTTINGVKFTGAILVGASFADANFSVDPSKGGAPPDFSNAYLQGVNLAGTNLTDTSLDGAFVDFGAPTNQNNGNIMQLLLGPQYTAFKGWEAPNAPVCVQAVYDNYTAAPTTIPSMTCPDGNQYASGCGATAQSNVQWASHTPIGQATPPGWYQYDATYTKADQSQACNSNTFNVDW